MEAMPSITVDEEVFAALQARAKPFLDTPNSVLRREFSLDLPGTGTGRRPPQGLTGRATRGAAIPQADYDLPVLTAIANLGGRASRDAVLRELGDVMAGRLGDIDRAQLSSGAVRWQKTASWAVKNMKVRGLVEPTPTAGWGVWAISDAGRKLLSNGKG